MSNSPAVRAARKDMQLKRLEEKAKGKKGDYPSFYANMPFQKVRAAKNETFRANKQAVKDAQDALDVAEVTGDGLEEATQALAVAELVASRSEPGRRGSSATLSPGA